MAVAAPKIAVHLYINNPYGLISATIPNYTVNKVDVDHKKTESESPLGKEELAGDTDLKAVEPVSKFKTRKDLAYGTGTLYGKGRNLLPEIHDSKRSSPSSDGSSPTVFYDRSPRSNAPAKGKASEPVHECPHLGFTWSINTEKREKAFISRQPPPRSLLEKMGGVKSSVEPVGIVKLKRETISPHNYLIHRIQLEEKGQRKMSEKLSEWLDQYTEVSQKQHEYLKRISELRRGLEHKDKRVISTIDKMRGEHKTKYRRKYPIYSLTRMEDAAVKQGPAPFPNRPSLFHDEKHGIPRLKIAPHTSPRKLAPIVTRVKTEKYDKNPEEIVGHQLTPRPEMTSMRTEYETFESIAKRNKLNLTQFFNSSLSHRRSHNRLPMNVSTVTILEERPDELEQKEFITDLSSRKPVVLNTGKDQKLS